MSSLKESVFFPKLNYKRIKLENKQEIEKFEIRDLSIFSFCRSINISILAYKTWYPVKSVHFYRISLSINQFRSDSNNLNENKFLKFGIQKMTDVVWLLPNGS